jgi:ketosteroid isomerase-like protein
MRAAVSSIAIGILVVILIGASVLATTRARADTKVPVNAAEVAELTRLSDAWDKAIVAKNKPAIADNMADDFRQISSNGDVADKQTFVNDVTSAGVTIDPYTVEDFSVRIYGDVALLSGTTRMTGREDGKEFKTHYRYTDIYRRINGKWKVCSVQTSRMPS